MQAILGEVQKGDYFRLNTLKILLKGTRTPSMYRGDHFKASLARILPKCGFEDLEVPFFCNAVRLETVQAGNGFDDR